MDKYQSDAFIYFFAKKYLSEILPVEVFETSSDSTIESAETQLMIDEWDKKVSKLSHWHGVIDTQAQQHQLSVINTYKQGLFNCYKLWIEYQGKTERFMLNPFGLINRDNQFFVIGSYWDTHKPLVLSVRKILSIELTNEKAITAEDEFDPAEFAQNYLNHPQVPHTLDKLVIEFPEAVYSYVNSFPIQGDDITISEPKGEPAYFRLQASNVTHSIRLQQWLSGFHDDVQIIEPVALRKIINRSYIDQLTNLYNRKGFDRLLQREVEKHYRNQDYVFSILIMDIDHFKHINDNHGHIFGDKVLVKVAECLREYDAIRYGGEEFVVLLENISAGDAMNIAERIRISVQALQIESNEKKVPVTISIGIAQYPDHLSEQECLLLQNEHNKKLPFEIKSLLIKAIIKSADNALYQAKDAGRNKVRANSSKR